MRIVFGRRSGRHGGNMPTREVEFTAQTAEVGIRIEGEMIVAELPHELQGAYLIG